MLKSEILTMHYTNMNESSVAWVGDSTPQNNK